MAEYICKFATPGGHVMNQTEQAASEAELRQRLLGQGYYVFSVHPKEAFKERLRSFTAQKIRADDFLIFNQQFLTLSKSGLPLQKSLDLLLRQTRSDELRSVLEAAALEVRAGKLLSEAFEAVGRLPKIYSATLRAGERSGNLDKVLAQYVTYQKATRGFRKRFISALIYPAFLVVFLFGLMTFVVTFIVPKFALLYSDLQVTLPPMTQFVISFSQTLNRWIIPILIAVVIVVFLTRSAFQSKAM